MMGALASSPFAATPIEQILSRFDRAQLEGFISVAIELLDIADGDLDVEPNGDELDGDMSEDDFCWQNANWIGAPGCPVSDPGGDPLDDGEAEDWRPDGITLPRPIYGDDQSLGPTNEREAFTEHRAQLLGLERSPSGGWRKRA
jgi:hypothetical protein